jgi:hypothetical protein
MRLSAGDRKTVSFIPRLLPGMLLGIMLVGGIGQKVALFPAALMVFEGRSAWRNA